MKRFLPVLALFCGTAAWVPAQSSGVIDPMLDADTRSFDLSGALDSNGEKIGYVLQARGGYFIMDFVEAGAYAGIARRGDHRSLTFGGYGEYHLLPDYIIVPYAGGSLGWVGADRHRKNYVELSAWAGARYFFTSQAAVGCELALFFASDGVYNSYYEDSMDWTLRIKTGFYF